MKKIGLLALAAMVLTACSQNESDVFNGSPVENQKEVTLTFSPYEMSTMTRTVTSIAGIVTHLDIWLYEDGNEVTAIHQSSDNSGFGSVSVTLDKTKTYTLYAVGHKCASDATLADGIISFPDDKVTHSMFYTTTFSPATTTSLTCEMSRIVSHFRLETTDVVPDECKKIRLTFSDVFDRWNVSTGATHQLDRLALINVTGTANDGTIILNLYNIVTDVTTNHEVTVEALSESDAVLQTQTFADVPMRNNYRTTYRGTFFTDTEMSMSFVVNDWNEFDVINF